MPTYVYECSVCEKVFEVDQRITEPPLDTCSCGSSGAVKRLIQPAGILFKGAGFHINDYAKPGSRPDAEAAAADTPTSDCTGDPATCSCQSTAKPK
jgi:putative FmdB family regulatory protein